jgi:integrase
VSGVTFHDLRGTAVLRLFLAGGTEAEIATITGHSLRDVRSILDSHYFCRDRRWRNRRSRNWKSRGRRKSAKSEQTVETVGKPL